MEPNPLNNNARNADPESLSRVPESKAKEAEPTNSEQEQEFPYKLKLSKNRHGSTVPVAHYVFDKDTGGLVFIPIDDSDSDE
jgi:hypothetical protein